MKEYDASLELCPYCGYEQGAQPASPLHITPGTVLHGRYQIGRVLGFGGFGVTYLAWDTVLRQVRAVKEYLPSEFATRVSGDAQVTVFSGKKEEQFQDGMQKFLDEASRLARFQNEPGIVRIYDSFEENQTAYLVMEYLQGQTLEQYLAGKGKIPVGQAAALLAPLAGSLYAVHAAGIIHRDIAPDNIFLTQDGAVKLIDFGAARFATTAHSRSLTVLIKPGYSPEEQYRSRGDQGPHTDVYALAAVLYRMTTGVIPPDALERRAFLENRKKDILIPPSKYCRLSRSQENAILNAMNVRIEDRTKGVDTFFQELNSQSPVERIAGKIKATNLAQWPRWARIAMPAAAALLLAFGILLFSGRLYKIADLKTELELASGMTRVPSVVNTSVSIAESHLEADSLASLIGGKVASDEVPADMVLAQSVDSGGIVPEGTTVELTISAGAETAVAAGQMPCVTFYTREDALSALDRAGVKSSVEYVYSSDVKEGLVVWQSVAAGEPVESGQSVTLRVSKGPDPAQDAQKEADEQKKAPLAISKEYLSLYVGDSLALSAEGGDGSYVWSSSDSGVVSVSDGTVVASGAGSAAVTVVCGSESKLCNVTVQDYSLSLSSTSLSAWVGDTASLSAGGAPSGASIAWSSSNSAVASVSGGSVTAAGSGYATITASFTNHGRNYSASCGVSVQQPGLRLSADGLGSLYVGDTRSLSAETSPGGGSVVWSSSTSSVASVSSGTVTAKSAGSASLNASFTYKGHTYTGRCSVSVLSPAVSLSAESLSMTVGESQRLSASVLPDSQSVSWSSGDSGVVSVSDGNLTAVGAGTASVTAKITYGGTTYSRSCTVRVAEPTITLSVSGLDSGGQATIQASVSGVTQGMSWSSSNTGVASVSSQGLVTVSGTGSTTITGSVSIGRKTYSASKTLTVASSANGSMSGYSIYKTASSWGDYGAWSDWSTTAAYDTDSRQVETSITIKIAYHYAHYCTGYVSGAVYQTSPGNNTGDAAFDQNCSYHDLGWFDSPLTDEVTVHGSTAGYYYYPPGSSTHYRCSNTCFRWYLIETRTTSTTYYHYRDRQQVTTNYFYRWS